MFRKITILLLYVLWVLSLAGILVITFTNFQYEDLNTIVAILFFFTALNTFFVFSTRR